ncbi:MAG: methyltransferase domain-containing protein [Bacteroidales bacterium]|nr:methyltransferase domain-containing protein [Candidatus Liminaster caballi]
MAAGGSEILDVGTGTGVLSLMLAQRFPDARITAIEIDGNAVLDARFNFEKSEFGERISLHHVSFQDFVAQHSANHLFDSVVCNPPYFDKSLECPDLGRLRARHSSSLPFDVLASGAYRLLKDGGVFSVCIPPEVLTAFKETCFFAGFSLMDEYQIKSVPGKEAKRYVLVHRKGLPEEMHTYTFCMRNEDRTRSDWYRQLMKDFLLG